LKHDISHFIVPRIKIFILKVENNEMECIPNWVIDNEENLSREELKKRWIKILKEMMVPFQYQTEANLFDNISIDEIDKRRERGLMLFAKYFEHLWD